MGNHDGQAGGRSAELCVVQARTRTKRVGLSPSLRGALATKQSRLSLLGSLDCFATLAMTVLREGALLSPPSFRGVAK
ncbi:hypothetical protein EOW77_0000055 [Bradyrhizobium yuanmingense]|nr:hypothetical protein EOW77_0000055 [Bradyrhizobium yuanmingense]